VDIGVWMSRGTLREKLALRRDLNPEAAWNLTHWPTGIAEGQNRLFVACDGVWSGYFTLAADALYHPDDAAAPFTVLFDTRTWTPMPPTPAKRFRGFTYQVPLVLGTSGVCPELGTTAETRRPRRTRRTGSDRAPSRRVSPRESPGAVDSTPGRQHTTLRRTINRQRPT
jgi:hypothetical protein